MTFTEREYFFIGLITIGLACIVVLWIFALAIKNKQSKWLFGTTNIRYYSKEIVKMYSANEKSWFSKKRIESGFAFIILQWGLVHWLILNITTIGVAGIIGWASIELAVCGYALKKIEDAKKSIV